MTQLEQALEKIQKLEYERSGLKLDLDDQIFELRGGAMIVQALSATKDFTDDTATVIKAFDIVADKIKSTCKNMENLLS